MFVKKSSRNKARGIGLLELMLSLAIIAILLVMATRYFITANESQKVNNAISIIHGIAGGAANYRNAHNGYTNMSTATLVTEHYIPSSFGGSAGAGAGANPWGGNITTSVVGSGFTVDLSGISNNATCLKVAGMINGAENNSADCATNPTTLHVVFH